MPESILSPNSSQVQSTKVNAVKGNIFLKYEVILSLLIVAIVISMTIADPQGFWSQSNINSLLVSISIVGIAAIGATLVILTGGIDISAGSVLGLVCTVVAVCGQYNLPLFLIIILALATGCIAGLLNGYLVAFIKLPAVIVTLGTLSIWRAGVFTLLGGQWGTNIPDEFSKWFIMTKILGIPLCFWLVVILVLIFGYLMRNRKWGRYIYALGNNEEATIFFGLPTKRILLLVYFLSGLLVSIAAFFSLGQSPTVQPSTGQGFELSTIAAVVIGGTAITGGRGSIIGGLLGAILVELVKDAIILFHIQPFWTGVAIGTMIIVAVLASLSTKKGGAN
ncbi:ABC transporter permease [Neobacillus pocheonensis]|uniref:ABC transporter permease n=1 Tax=Neobacillus pocheonensis TaxID=363869 RepID=UPI003D277DDD